MTHRAERGDLVSATPPSRRSGPWALNAGGLEELPNERATFGPVVIQGLVRPFAGYQDAPPGDAEVFGFVGLALALPGCHGVSGAVGLDAIEQPHRAPGRAGGDCSSAWSRWAWSRWASVACSPSPAASPMLLVKYFVR